MLVARKLFLFNYLSLREPLKHNEFFSKFLLRIKAIPSNNQEEIWITNEEWQKIKETINDTKALKEFIITLSDNYLLSAEFEDWGFIISSLSETIAHRASRTFTLPDGFNQWEIADKRGVSVAHEFVLRGNFSISNIPSDWDWDLKDGFGNTVRDVYNASKIMNDYSIDV